MIHCVKQRILDLTLHLLNHIIVNKSILGLNKNIQIHQSANTTKTSSKEEKNVTKENCQNCCKIFSHSATIMKTNPLVARKITLEQPQFLCRVSVPVHKARRLQNLQPMKLQQLLWGGFKILFRWQNAINGVRHTFKNHSNFKPRHCKLRSKSLNLCSYLQNILIIMQTFHRGLL